MDLYVPAPPIPLTQPGPHKIGEYVAKVKCHRQYWGRGPNGCVKLMDQEELQKIARVNLSGTHLVRTDTICQWLR